MSNSKRLIVSYVEREPGLTRMYSDGDIEVFLVMFTVCLKEEGGQGFPRIVRKTTTLEVWKPKPEVWKPQPQREVWKPQPEILRPQPEVETQFEERRPECRTTRPQ